MINPELLILLEPLYDGICYKCHFPIRLISEMNHTEEAKAHHISKAAEEIIAHRDFTEVLFEIICDLYGKTQYLEFVFKKMQKLSPQDDKNFLPYLEVYLFTLQDGLRNYPALDQPAISLVQMYVELAAKEDPNGQHPLPICVRRSFLKVFRSLATCPQKDPEFMYRIMCITISCFDEPFL